ncbi:HAD family hydrolase [Peptoniphilus vaginalis]|uniref:HAD family hydrolase n=1 Tax=Peptoniphilus vaginalis TaxID=1756987 RepID=UPI0023FA4518|nr:HAD family hydrolase [Peptoniphilus vaginalis]
MSDRNYFRKHKERLPVIAICYDFDKTLTPNEMQAQGYIQSLGYEANEFWNKSNGMAEDNDMDENLSYMYMMVNEFKNHHKLDRKTLEAYGAEVKLFLGVDDWFRRIREYGLERGVLVEHYIISSGIKEMIEGTEIAKKGEFEKIYASSFYFDDKGIARWPAQVVNYTNKTQFLFRIQKGTLDINDPGINDYFPPDEIRVPFRNIIYIGDSDTDIPCMKLVNTYGGFSVGVYNPEHSKDKVYKMIKDNRIKYFAPADYREDKELDLLIKNIIERTVVNEKLESRHYNCLKEAIES